MQPTDLVRSMRQRTKGFPPARSAGKARSTRGRLSFANTLQRLDWGSSQLLSKLAKRGLDLLGATVGEVVLFLINAIVAPLIRLEDGGAILFTQERVGRHGKTFKALKFRSMRRTEEAERQGLEAGPRDGNKIRFKIRDGPRTTGVGPPIRRCDLALVLATLPAVLFGRGAY